MEESSFAEWIATFPNENPTDQDLDSLSIKLCTVATEEKDIQRLFSKRSVFVQQQTSVVSWRGISSKWFFEVFMKCAQVKQFIQFECPMWFIRNFCIPHISPRQENGSSACIADVLETDQNEEQIIADPSVFLSYTGSYSLSLFSDLLKNYETSEFFFWCDMFCVDQVAWRKQDTDFKSRFMYLLQEQVSKTPFTVLLIDSWDSVLHPLGQIWVLWEVFSCIESTSSVIKVLLPSEEVMRTLDPKMFFSNGRTTLFNGLAAIDVCKADARYKEDKELIMNIIKCGKGVSYVNEQIISVMQHWHLENCKLAVDSAFDFIFSGKEQLIGGGIHHLNDIAWWYFELGRTIEAERIFQRLLEICKKRYTGGENEGVLYNVMSCLASLYLAEEKNLDLAAKYFREVHEQTCNHYDKDDIITMRSAFNIAGVYSVMDEIGRAMDIYNDLIARLPPFDINEDDDRFALRNSTLMSISDMSSLSGDHVKAVDYATKAYELTKVRVGERHPDTLINLQKLADRLSSQEKFELAEEKYSQCLGIQREMFVHTHPSTLTVLNNFAENQYRLCKYEEAQLMFQQAIEGYQSCYGEDNEACADSKQGLGMVYFKQGKLEQALQLVREVEKLYRKKYGDVHRITREATVRVALVLDGMGDHEKAEQLCKELVRAYIRRYGEKDLEKLFQKFFEGSSLYERTMKGYCCKDS